MTSARLMDRPEDYEKIGVKPGVVEAWEDARRGGSEPGVAEIWYFDCVMDDGTKLILGFRPKSQDRINEHGDDPNVQITLTPPGGESRNDFRSFAADDASFSLETCDVKIGPHRLTGDLTQYHVTIVPEADREVLMDGTHSVSHDIGVDLHFTAESTPFRPGTGYIALGADDEFYLTFLCVPKLLVAGTLTYEGVTHQVQGLAYQNHQWMNISSTRAWHHWLWGRQNSSDYTIVIYDLVANEEFGFARVPLFYIEDSKGVPVLDTVENVKVEVLETYFQPETGKDYPRLVRYSAAAEGKSIEYTLRWQDQIEIRDFYSAAPPEGRAAFDKAGLQPTYTRYFAIGDLVVTEGDEVIRSTGNMIYEFLYSGKPDVRAGL
ncbi:lipocalin-like domain-containing protein [uncultured Brevundimonas sp.]|uniref:lipocalin-like domain-containing protein n=1 Tax=uncultured Brevundimonas sp. TaxID=213418 RepID=UPI0025DDA7EE|nr:lipocalin-like domain-containing protein [uncultured Brevundimonas sp.]